jgi:quercetin dioxygenase-like cupin family protein
VEISSGKPYKDVGVIRIFSSDVDGEELVWHRDREDRKITVLEGEGWQFQFNGSLPFELTEGRKFNIPEGMYHRVIKGKTDLVLKVKRT